MIDKLILQGRCSDPIWVQVDGEEPFSIGIRMDCGDAGVVYLTRDQAYELLKQLDETVTALDEESSISGAQ